MLRLPVLHLPERNARLTAPQRLNLPHVVQTDMVYEVRRTWCIHSSGDCDAKAKKRSSERVAHHSGASVITPLAGRGRCIDAAHGCVTSPGGMHGRTSQRALLARPAESTSTCATGVDALQQEYEAECAAVSKGESRCVAMSRTGMPLTRAAVAWCVALDSMLRKCLSDGKALVIEGLHCHAVRARRARPRARLCHAARQHAQRMYASRIQELWAEEPTRQAPVVVPIALQLNSADRRVRRR